MEKITMATSFQNEIPPARVNIRLSVQGRGEAENIEIPFKVLILGEFRTEKQKQRVVEREKLKVDRENLDAVMKSLDLSLQFQIENVIQDSQESLDVDLHFRSLRDFSPESIVDQVPELGKLLAGRNLIRDLGSILMDSRSLRKELEQILREPIKRKEFIQDMEQKISFHDARML